MNRLPAHIGDLHTELPLAGRPAAAARDGFTAIEHPASDPRCPFGGIREFVNIETVWIGPAK